MELDEARRLVSRAFSAELEGDSDARTRELTELIASESTDRVFEAARCLAGALPVERAVSAHVLRQLYEVSQDVRVVEQVVAMLGAESEPTVVAPLLTALGWTGLSAYLPVLLEYRADGSEIVRHAVSDVLGRFAPSPRAVAALIELAADNDADIRWSAVYELGAWIREINSDEIVSVLDQVVESDPDPEVRAVALDGLVGARRGP